MALGVLLMLGLDEFTPHEHGDSGPCGPGHERCDRVWLFVVSHEVIPQTHCNGHQTPATLGLMLGFALMMVLDTTLG